MSTKQRHTFEPDYAVPPGETLREVMASSGMTQRELAQRTGLTEQSLHRIIRGEQPLSHETANQLEQATGVPASLWNGLEATYRGQLARLAEREWRS